MTDTTTQRKPTIGWIGVGKMGAPMAHRLIGAGFSVSVYGTSAQRAAEWSARGAGVSADIATLAAENDWIFSCVPDDEALRQVALSSSGVLANARKGSIYIDMSTVSPAISASVRTAANALALDYIAAPVSGSTASAETAQLTVFASGAEAPFDLIRPALRAFSARQYYVGAAEQARYLKLAINHLLGSTAAVLAEALTLGKMGGLDWSEMLTAIGDSVVASPVIQYKLGPLRDRNFAAAFSSSQMLKDMTLAVEAGTAAGVPMAAATLVRDLYAQYVRADGAELDFFSIVRAVEAAAGAPPGRITFSSAHFGYA